MTSVKELDLSTAPLEGTNLIEASAGTGKTYTISGLFLRLVLEKGLSVDQILVVTFTEAATDELKHRIRSQLRRAINAFTEGFDEDTFLNDLVKKGNNSEVALRHLREALRAFDQAAIFTIHGFCRRMLYENAFESGSLFDTELVADQEELKAEIVYDFWRKHIYEASHLFVHYVFDNKVSPDSLLSLLGNRVTQPHLRIIPRLEISDTSPQEKVFQACFKRVRLAWQSDRSEVESILLTHEGLSRTKYREANVAGWIQSMDDYVASEGKNVALFKGFEKFTSREIEGAAKKNRRPPTHPFFDLCEALKQEHKKLVKAFEQRLLGLKAALFGDVQRELAKRKEEKNIQSFEDLLIRLHRALEEEGGNELAKAIGTRYKAALIDEFQDTDPIQFAIFKKVFGSKNSILFLIGDPKQAIYSFRNADIFAYMDAAASVERRYTLKKNWRSEPDLIAGTNTLFSNTDHPFVYDRIPFQPATAAARKDPELLTMEGKTEPSLQLWFVNASKVTGLDKPMTKSLTRQLIPVAVAAEISRLLHLARRHKILLGGKVLEEGDIAVLVRRNDEARLMQEVLAGLHIPSVLHSTADLFQSHEAQEMERLLAGIVEPNNEKLVKAALATDMIGVRGEGLESLMKDGIVWEQWLVKFREYHDLWNKNGFIQMFRYLLLEEKVMTRLMSLHDGERRNTNVLHLSEVLHEASAERKLGMARLLKWLSEQRDPDAERLEEHQLRLESDENAVKLVTIHKSKGLEYPVVFCPFAWDGSRARKPRDLFTFHNEADHMRLTLDLGSENMDGNRLMAEKEQLAENVRLLYVALTRAKNRCYLVWGRFNEAETSAQAHLFHQRRSLKGRDVLSALEERFTGLSDEGVLAELESIQAKACGSIEVSAMPTEAGKACSPSRGERVTLACREFSGIIDRSWQIASFSSLVTDELHTADLADHDATALPEPHDEKVIEPSTIKEELSGIFAFPRGTKAGTFMHDIFEHLDFSQGDPSQIERLVADKLREYGFEFTWLGTLCHMIQKVLSIPLEPSHETFTLSRIGSKDRLNELEFYFPLKSISPRKLNRVFRKYAGRGLPADFPERIERLHFSPVRGFLKGFMDMVFQFEGRFYLVDWKSNVLGSRVEDYGQESLAETMKQECYILQYHLYAIALNQYLQVRLPGYNYENHFGAVYYIFLRGVDPDWGPGFGIFRDRPSGELISELCASLIDCSVSQG
jgi:exodeoxyribonuclease V beta subunit